MIRKLKSKFLYTFIALIILMFTVVSGKSYATNMINERSVQGSGTSFGWSDAYYNMWDQFCAELGTNFGTPEPESEAKELHGSPDFSFILSSLNDRDYTYLCLTDPIFGGGPYTLGGGKTGAGYSGFQWAIWANSEGTPYGITDNANFSDLFDGTAVSSEEGNSDSNISQSIEDAIEKLNGSNMEDSYMGSYSIRVGNSEDDWKIENNVITINGTIINCPKDINDIFLTDAYNLNLFFEDTSKIFEKDSNLNSYKIKNFDSNTGSITLECNYQGQFPENRALLVCLVTKKPGEGVANSSTSNSINNQSAENVGLLPLANAYNSFIASLCKQQVDNTDEWYKEITGPDSVTYTIPNIQEDKLFDAKFDDMEAYWDSTSDSYVIGPIKIKGDLNGYSRYGYEFSHFGGFEIYSDFGPVENYNINPETNSDDTIKIDDNGYATYYLTIPYKDNMTKITSINVNYSYLIAGANFAHYTCGNGQDQIVVKNAARWYEDVEIETPMSFPLPYYLNIEKKVLNEDNQDEEVFRDFGKNTPSISDIVSDKEYKIFEKSAKFNVKRSFNDNYDDDNYKPKFKLLDDNENENENEIQNWAFKYVDEEGYVDYTKDYEKVKGNDTLIIVYSSDTDEPKLEITYYDTLKKVTIKDNPYGSWLLDEDGNVIYEDTENSQGTDETVYDLVGKTARYTSIESSSILPYENGFFIDSSRFLDNFGYEKITSGESVFRFEYGNEEVSDWCWAWVNSEGNVISANSQRIDKVKRISKINDKSYFGDLIILFNDKSTDSAEDYKLVSIPNYYLSTQEAINILGDENAVFHFKVDIDYQNGKDTETDNVSINVGENLTVGPFYAKGNKAPKYKIIELDEDGTEKHTRDDSATWKLISIIDGEGTLREGETVFATAVNKLHSHSAKLVVKKALDGGPAEEDTTFKFKLTVTDSNGNELTALDKDGNEVTDDVISIEVREGEEEAYSEEYTYKWYGNQKPTYTIEEETHEGYENVSIVPEKGELNTLVYGDVDGDGEITSTDATMVYRHLAGVAELDQLQLKLADFDGDKDIDTDDVNLINQRSIDITSEYELCPMEIIATNKKIDKEPVKLTIKKEMVDGVESDEIFTFYVRTEGATNNLEADDGTGIPIKIKAGDEATFTFYQESEETPVGYEIKESIPDNSKTQFKEYIVKNGDDEATTSTENPISGTINANDGNTSVVVVARNEVITPTKGGVKVQKIFDDESENERKVTFGVHVFVPNDVELEKDSDGVLSNDSGIIFGKCDKVHTNHDNETCYVAYPTVTVPAGKTTSEIWESGNLSWYGDKAPTYEIEEVKAEEVIILENGEKKYNDILAQYQINIPDPTGDLKEDADQVNVCNLVKNVKLTLTKKLSENGNQSTDKEFTFNVKVKNVAEVISNRGNLNEDSKEFTDKVKIAPNKSVTYEFKYEGDELPVYEIIEDKDDDYKIESITSNLESSKISDNDYSITGTLTTGTNTEVTAVNTLNFSNTIQINKSIEGGIADADELFVFTVNIYKNENLEETKDAEIVVRKGQTTGDKPWTYAKEWTDKNDKYTYKILDEHAYEYDYDKKARGNEIDAYNPKGIPAGGEFDGSGSVIEIDVENWKKGPENKQSHIIINKEFDTESTNPRRISFEATSKELPVGIVVPNDANYDSKTNEYKWNGIIEVSAKSKKGKEVNSGDFTFPENSDYDLMANTYVKETRVEEFKNGKWEDVTNDYDNNIKPVKKDENEYYFNIKNTEKKSNKGTLKIEKKFIGGDSSVPRKIKADVIITIPGLNDETKSPIKVKPAEFKWDDSRKGYVATVNLEIPAGSDTATSGNYGFEWYGDKKLHYDVKEVEVSPDEGYSVEYEKESGDISNNSNALVKIKNTKGASSTAKLKIRKELSKLGEQDKEKKFEFDVKVENVKSVINGGTGELKGTTFTDTIKIKPDSASVIYEFEYDETNPAKFTVKEKEDDNSKLIEIKSTAKDSKKDGNNVVTGTLSKDSLVTVTAINEEKVHNHISITKQLAGPADTDEYFVFKVTIGDKEEYGVLKVDAKSEKAEHYTTITVNNENYKEAITKVSKWQDGQEWKTSEYYWYESDDAPKYTIEEVKCFDNQFNDITKRYNPSIPNNEGNLDGSQKEIKVDAFNYYNIKKAYLTIEKKLAKDQNTACTFDFRVEIKGNDKVQLIGATDNTITFDVFNVPANEKRGPYEVSWLDTTENGDGAPTYKVWEINTLGKHIKEITFEAYLQEWNENDKLIKETETETAEIKRDDGIQGISGTLVQAEKIDTVEKDVDERRNVSNITAVKCTNTMEEITGSIEVEKQFVPSKTMTEDQIKHMAESQQQEFTAQITIKGDFWYKDKNKQNSQYEHCTTKITDTVYMTSSNKWKAESNYDIKWYGKNSAPKVKVEEINIPEGWNLITTTPEDEISMKDGTISFIIKNRPDTPAPTLETSMGGFVWEDEKIVDKIGESTNPNGIYDENETGISDIRVNVYKVFYEKATDGKPIEKGYELVKTLKTEDGKWEISKILLPGISAEEKIKYNLGEEGKTYYAKYSVEFVYDGQTYEPTTLLKSSSEENLDAYYKTPSDYFKSSLARQSVDASRYITEIKGNQPIDANGDTTGVAVVNNDNESIYYHADNLGVSYPVKSRLKTISDKNGVYDVFQGKAETQRAGLLFPATEVDKKTIPNGAKEVDGILHDVYKIDQPHMEHINVGLVKKPDVDIGLTTNLSNVNIAVKGKLYQYKYSSLYDFTETKTEKLNLKIADDNHAYSIDNDEKALKLQLGLYKSDYYYRAEIYNNDKKLYDELINYYKNITKRVATLEETEMDVYLTYKIKVVNPSNYRVRINAIDDYYDENLTLIEADEYKVTDTTIAGFNGEQTVLESPEDVCVATKSDVDWKQLTTGLLGSDGIAYNKMITNTSFELAPDEEKEITLSFKVNKNLDMSNIELGQRANIAEIESYSTLYNESSDNKFNKNAIMGYKYGDNSGKIDLDSAPSNLNLSTNNLKKGYEDDTLAAPIVKLQFKNNGRTITGIAWEDERVKDPNSNYEIGDGKYEKDEKKIDGLKTELIEKVMIPNYKKDAQGNATTQIESYTAYDFLIPTDIVLDSLGNKTLEEVTNGFKTTTETLDGGKYEFTNVPVGDYVVRFTYGDKEIKSQAKYSTASYYNGQDYKSSIYKLNDGDTETLLKLDNYNNKADKHQNIAVDNEVRRLQVIEKSREITNENGKVLASGYDDKYAMFRNKLYDEYHMFADTPIIRFNELNKLYNLQNIDFALEERPLTKITLDKQIKEILIKTSDGRTLMDAVYNIEYNAEGKATVTLDTTKSIGTDNLQALNRDDATNNGFRYINVDSELLQGATITVKYQFTAINTGEVDYTGKLNDISFNFNDACEDLSTKLTTYDSSKNNSTPRGEYLGNHYYYGTGEDDVVVTSTVKELVDYLDNDIEFSSLLNKDANTAWKSSSEDKLVGLIENTETIKDKNNVAYSKNGNLITSINSDVNTITTEKLTPGKSATIELTVSKIISADSDDLKIDNIAEIIRYTNAVGRRNNLAVTGNLKPAEFDWNNPNQNPNPEPDESITETITLSPPTGSSIMVWRLQVVGAIALSMTIVAGGIILIKKKVLK